MSSGLIEVAVPGGELLWFGVDPLEDDPHGDRLLASGRVDGAGERIGLELAGPSAHVVDLGCGLGTFAVPAAAAGANVLALDPSPARLDLVRAAAARNGLDGLRLERVRTDAAGRPLWPGIDELLDRHRWSSAEVIKVDVGSAAEVLMTSAGCLRRSTRPRALLVVWDDSAGPPAWMHELLPQLGYELFLVDARRPGTLVRSEPGDLQTELHATYLAVTGAHRALGRWRIEPGLPRATVAARLAASAASDASDERRHAAGLLARGPAWLAADPAVRAVLRALEGDVCPPVRSGLGASTAALADPGANRSSEADATDSDAVLDARDVSLRSAQGWLEGVTPHPDELELEGLTIRLWRGEVLGIVSGPPLVGLVSVLAGASRPAAGRLEIGTAPIVVSGVERLVEGRLTAAQNVVVLGSFFGAHPADLARRTPAIMSLAGLEAGDRLGSGNRAREALFALAVAVECAAPDCLLVIDRLPALGDRGIRQRVRERLSDLVRTGVTIVEAASDPGRLLVRPDRLLWAADGKVIACGHPQSVAFAYRRGDMTDAPPELLVA